MKNFPITVFTKPWKRPDLQSLAKQVKEMGFDGVELAVRPGYQVEPDNAVERLPEATRIFADHGLRIESVAADLTPRMVEACAAANVPLLRTMLPIDPDVGYGASVDRFRGICLELQPYLDNTSVRIGLQNHCGNFVGTAMGLMEAISPLPEYVVAVLDFAHTSLTGEPEPYALEIALPRLALVNLKNALYAPDGKNEQGETLWRHTWVGAKEGLTSWSLVMDLLRKNGYNGPVCLTAEYRNTAGQVVSEEETLSYIQPDLAYLKSI